MIRLNSFLALFLFVFGLSSLQVAVGAVENKQDPFANIEEMTSELLVIIAEHKSNFPNNESAYFDALNNLMTGFVDFDFVAKKVMGKYAKSSAKDQRERFEAVFRKGLVETYGRGLMSYGNEKIVLVNQQTLPAKQRRVLAKQEIRSDAGISSELFDVPEKIHGRVEYC